MSPAFVQDIMIQHDACLRQDDLFSNLGIVRFLTTYADDLKSLARTTEVVQALVEALFLALTAGETFLPVRFS